MVARSHTQQGSVLSAGSEALMRARLASGRTRDWRVCGLPFILYHRSRTALAASGPTAPCVWGDGGMAAARSCVARRGKEV
jgi:hypothetical protein